MHYHGCTAMIIGMLALLPTRAFAYTFEVHVGTAVLTAQTIGTPLHWAVLPVPLTPALDGGPFDAAVVDAAQTWNNAVAPTFMLTEEGPTLVRWAAPGELPHGFAAWTTKKIRDGSIVEAEVLLDPLKCWAVYTGPLRSTLCAGRWEPLQEVRRVVLHELGHVVGLSHPDDGGQHVDAIMNSTEGDLEHVTTDDVAGMKFLREPPSGSVLAHPSGGGGGCTAGSQGSILDMGILAFVLLGWGAIRTYKNFL